MNSIHFSVITLAASLVGCQGAKPPCAGWEPTAQTIVAGGRAELPIPATARAALVNVTSGAGIEAWREGDDVIVRANYVAGEDSLTLTCDSGAITVPITVEPLAFEPLVEWEPSATTGPAGREYFAWWMADGGENALYLYGGFVYEPKQFTPSQELWRFDLGTKVWTTVAQTGEPPPPGGASRRAASPVSGITTAARCSTRTVRSIRRPCCAR